jgi:hypothetical protein
MNPGQIANVHIAKSQLKLSDGEYRLILRNLGGVESSKDLTNQSLEKLMAFFEDRGFRQKDQPQDYWRRKYHAQGQFCGERMVHLIHQLSQQVKYPLDSLVAKASKGRTARAEELNPAEANQLVEMLKSMAGRESGLNTKARSHEGQLVQQNLFGMPDAPGSRSPKPKPEPAVARVDPVELDVMSEEEIPF